MINHEDFTFWFFRQNFIFILGAEESSLFLRSRNICAYIVPITSWYRYVYISFGPVYSTESFLFPTSCNICQLTDKRCYEIRLPCPAIDSLSCLREKGWMNKKRVGKIIEEEQAKRNGKQRKKWRGNGESKGGKKRRGMKEFVSSSKEEKEKNNSRKRKRREWEKVEWRRRHSEEEWMKKKRWNLWRKRYIKMKKRDKERRRMKIVTRPEK